MELKLILKMSYKIDPQRRLRDIRMGARVKNGKINIRNR